jgi:putative ABC transport system ATP-binding protein
MNNNASHTLFHIKDIQKDFRNGDGILFNGNVRIKKADFSFITGANGVGKSTLINILGLLDTAELQSDDGVLTFCPEEEPKNYMALYKQGKFLFGFIDPLAKIRRRYFGFLPQEGHLIDSLTVWENLEVMKILRTHYRGSDTSVSQILDKMISQDEQNQVITRKYLKKSPANLSGGFRQRLVMERATLDGPRVIFADEPTNNMDREVKAMTIKRLIQFVREGGSVIMVTHDYYEALNIIKEVFEKNKGDWNFRCSKLHLEIISKSQIDKNFEADYESDKDCHTRQNNESEINSVSEEKSDWKKITMKYEEDLDDYKKEFSFWRPKYAQDMQFA